MAEFLHLDFRPASAWWIGQLQAKARRSRSKRVRARYETWAESGLGELALALATKLEVRQRVAKRFHSLMQRLLEDVDRADDLGRLLEGGFVFTPRESGLLYDICDSVDSILFESRSAYEITGKFVSRFSEVLLERPITQEDLIQVLRDAKQDVSWIEELRANRIRFFHYTAPWIALEVQQRKPLQFQLLVLKENVTDFTDRSKYITQSELSDVWDGYERSMVAIKGWLEGQMDAIAASEART